MADIRASNGIWNEIVSFFSSVRLTIVLLLSLAVTSIIGTVIPQNAAPARYFMQYGEFWFRIFSVFDFFDMYHSWWFQAMLILLAINIVVCSIERLRATWSVIFPSQVNIQPERFRKSGIAVSRTFPGTPDQVQEALMHHMGKQAHIHTASASGKSGIFWETGRKSRLGVYVVHLSVVLLLVGGLMGSMWGFDGSVTIPEGESADTIQLGTGNVRHALDFAIRCDDFQIRFYENGMPSEYRSTLTILEKGQPVLTRDILVNDPLTYKGVTIYQASYGTVPSKNKAVFEFTSRDSGMVYRLAADVGQTITLPENLGTFTLKEFVPSYRFKGHDLGETFLAVHTPPEGGAVEIAIPTQFPSFDKMRKGIVAVSVGEAQTRYATGLQVTYDPGVWVVYTGFLLMIAGCYVTFFRSHRQVYIEFHGSDGNTRVDMYGIANRNRLGMERWIERLNNRMGVK
uniref:Cytochrome c biogenesis protein ResB n=1 Tax=Desulfatirhabdium butyrativorans TaxID=340467 RepID=A0A7C4RUF6_9BACT